MGCDIHTYAERKVGDAYELIKDMTPFDWRSYGMFGFFADVRNYSDVPALAPDRGLPNDASEAVKDAAYNMAGDAHSHSWLSVAELAAFNYDQPLEDRRVTREIAPGFITGGATAEPGGGEMTTYREFLGEVFFRDLDQLKAAGADRVVFWFDN